MYRNTEITAATDIDMIRLGVAAIGDRVRLREVGRKRDKEHIRAISKVSLASIHSLYSP